MRSLAVLVGLLVITVGCVSTPTTPTAAPPPTLPIATGIPVTPKAQPTRLGIAAPTATVETLPTPDTVNEMFAAAGDLFAQYKPPETNPKPLYDALADASIAFLTATANADVSMEGQPALTQLREALALAPNLPRDAKPQVAAVHTGDDQGGSRDLIFIALQGVMGLPVLGLERLGASYQILPPLGVGTSTTADDRYFYPGQLDVRDVTGDETKELIYVIEYPGGSGTTNVLTVARWLAEANQLRTIFHASLINWAGESDYEIEQAADASTLKLTFPWFGAFDHKLLAHPNAVQTWEYDDRLDRFVQVSQTIDPPTSPREQLNAAEYALSNGDLNGALELYQKVWTDDKLQPEDFGESKADPKAFAKFRAAMLAGVLGNIGNAKTWLGESQKSGAALKQVADTYARNSSGNDGALRGWIAIANAGDLYQLFYESRAGNLDFPFEPDEVYLQGGVLSTFLNIHAGAEKDPDAVWSRLDALGLKPLSHYTADLDGDGTPEFLFVTQEGGDSPNKAQSLWFVYKRGDAWRVRRIENADTLQIGGELKFLPNAQSKAVPVTDSNSPTPSALTWDGTRILWLDAATLEPRSPVEGWPSLGGGVNEDDF